LLKLLVAAVVFILPLRALSLPGMGGATLGLVLALFLIPIAWNKAPEYPIQWPEGLFIASLISAPFLLTFARADHEVDASAFTGYFLILVGALLTSAALLWSRNELGLRARTLLYSAGGYSSRQCRQPPGAPRPGNSFCVPVTIFLAALLYKKDPAYFP
jgi:hypothetical protein